MEQTLDPIDLQLLDLLQGDCRLTVKQLAARVHLSTTPVFERIKRLEQEGYIDKYIAILNAEKLGRGFAAFCNVRLKQHSYENINRFLEDVRQIPEITECYNISGEHDFMLKIYVSSMREYQDFVLHTMGKMDCIGSLNSFFILGEVKNSHHLPL